MLKKIDSTKVLTPNVIFTPRAFDELKLIITNDFTLAGKWFRILISGKGCDGFTYSAGFTNLDDEDLEISIGPSDNSMTIIMDPFTAFYLQDCHVDYLLDEITGHEGFVVTNQKQKDFHGKFWKESPETVPPLAAKI